MRKTQLLSLVAGAAMCLANLSARSQCTLTGWATQNGGVTGGGTATATVVTTYDAPAVTWLFTLATGVMLNE